MTEVPRELWPILCRLATSREWPPRGDADVAAFFDYANHQRLLSLLIADDDLPQEVIAAKPRFRALDALSRKRYELSRAGVLELQRVLGADAFVFYKGSDYRHHLYDRPEQRPMADIDVYIPSVELPAALRKLEAAGYSRTYVDFAGFSPWHYEISVVVAGVHVELHRGFSQRVRAAMITMACGGGANGSSGTASVATVCRPPTRSSLTRSVLAKDEFSSELNRFLDFYLLLATVWRRIGSCVARAKAWQIERPLFGALHLTSAMFPGAKTAAVSQAMDAVLDPPTASFWSTRFFPTRPRSAAGGFPDGACSSRKLALIDRRWRRAALVVDYIHATAVGLVFEWRARRGGLNIPPRSMVRSHNRWAAIY